MNTVARTLTAPNGKTVTTALTYTEAVAMLKYHPSNFAADLLAKIHADITLTKNQAIFVFIFGEETLMARRLHAAEVVAPEAFPGLVAKPAPVAEVPEAIEVENAEARLSEIEAREALFFSTRHINAAPVAPVVEVAAPVAAPAPVAVSAPVVTTEAGQFAPIIAMFETARATGGKKFVLRMDIGDVYLEARNAAPTGKHAGGVHISGYGEDSYYGTISAQGAFTAGRKCFGDVIRALEIFAADTVKACAEYGHKTGDCCFCGRVLTDNKEGSSVELGYGPHCAKKWGLPHGKKEVAAAAA